MRRAWVLPLLLLSGFSGLAYELLWVRLLTLSLGATTASFSIVLAVFFGGLALGARWAGKRSVGAKRPLATYAALEALTGILGVALYPVLKHLGAVVASFDPGTGSAGLVMRVVVSAVLLLPPTFLMGATLPYISVGTIERDDATGPGTALIYGLNTLGACLGAFFVTFVMLPHLGVFASTMTTALVNLTVAAIAFAMSRRADGDGAAAPSETAEVVADPRRRLAVIVAAGLGGLVATGAQVVWARLFTISLRGTSYGVGSVLVVVLVGIALGSLVASAVSRRARHLATVAVVFQLLFLIGLAVFAATTPMMSWLVGTLGNSGLVGTGRHLAELLAVFFFLFLPTVAAGAILPSLVAVAEGSARNAGKTLAELYSANTLGCILGSLATGFFLLPGIGSSATLYLMFLVLAATTVIFAVATCADRRPVIVLATIVALTAAAVFPQTDPRLLSPRANAADYFSFIAAQRQSLASITSYYEGDVATVTVTETGDNKGLSLNGLGQGSRAHVAPFILHESVLVATTPWLHAKNQRRGLVVGLGAGGTVDVLLQLGVEQLEVAELERGVVDAVAEIWGDDSPLKNPRVTLINNDARNHLLTASRRTPGGYDLITSMPAHPWVAAALFTREFFELARENLADGGVFSTWFGPGEMPDASIEGLFGAFTAVFPHTVVYWVPEAGAFYLVGAKQPLTFDVGKAESLLSHPVMAGRAREQARALFMASRVTGVTTPTHPSTARLVSTDDNGVIEFGAQRPRTAGVLASLTYLPLRALPASMFVNAPDPTAFALEALENALSSRGGWLPFRGADAAATVRAVSAIEATSPLSAYAAFRKTFAQPGKRPEAVALANAITDPVLAARARVIIASTDPDPTVRIAGLKSYSSRPDVRALLLSLGEPDDGPVGSAPLVDDDPIGWLFVAPEAMQGLDGEARARITRTLTQRIAAFESPVLAQKAQRLFAAAGWSESSSWAASLILDMERSASGVLVRRALEAGTKERYADAVRLLLEASRLAPLREPQVRTLLQAALRLDDQSAIKAARDMLLMRGFERVTIEGIEANLRNANAKEAAKPPAP